MLAPRITLILALAALVVFLGVSGTEAKKGEVHIILGCIDFNPDDCSDRDGDGWIGHIESIAGSDYSDPTSTPEHGLVDEQLGTRACSDGVDNDGDGRSDNADVGCRVTCHDYLTGLLCNDRDHDGWLRYVEDLYGSDPFKRSSTLETFWLPETCTDGADNDGDGFADEADSGCGIADCADFDAEADCEPF